MSISPSVPQASDAAGKRVLLVSMPWMNPDASCLALSTLSPILAAAGIASDTLYGSVLFPRTDTDSNFLDHYGSFLFVPYLYPNTDVELLLDRLVQRYFDDINLHGILSPSADAVCAQLGIVREDVRRAFRTDIERAGVCLARCFARAAQPQYDIVGFSLTFETQIPAALALTRRLKEQNPALKVVFGGAACLEEQADGLVSSFPLLDAVCHTEGEEVVVPLMLALRGERPLSAVPGIAYRDASGEVVHTASPPLMRDLDRLPIPRYEDYLAQLGDSEWRDVKPKLFFETSRGCWWGQKHLCTFCGLNAEGLEFRSKSAERAYNEIHALYWDFPQAQYLQATDNILETKYFHTLLPRLAQMERDPQRPLHIFFEVKSNMKPQQLALLAMAGIKAVQPGIESFDDQVLQLMDKGCTGLGQVQFIKWATQEGVQPIYNVLICNPGEKANAYRQMTAMLPFLAHLPPPSGVTRMELERFSPYFERAATFGITNQRPKPYYRDLYPESSVDLMRISYQFDYDHPMQHDAELQSSYREFSQHVIHWSRTYRPHRAFYLDRGDHLIVVDRRGPSEQVAVLAGPAADLYRYLDTARPYSMIEQRFAHLDPDMVRCMLERWVHYRWAYRAQNDQHLAVLPQLLESPRELGTVMAGAPRPANRPIVAAAAKRPSLNVIT